MSGSETATRVSWKTKFLPELGIELKTPGSKARFTNYWSIVSPLYDCKYLTDNSWTGKPRPVGAEKALYRYLLSEYEPGVRPVINHNTTLAIKLGIKLNQILDLVCLLKLWYSIFTLRPPLPYMVSKNSPVLVTPQRSSVLCGIFAPLW